jgi:DNA mismatch repair protein MutL
VSTRPVIRLLPDQVINRIAAGEVVERPASVVKELVENAIDAGATEIEVRVVAGGRKLLQIADNGCGMSRDEALLSVERHATSKIRDERDLESVRTLGFRGEALASVASVSRFTLTTRPADALEGTELIIHGGVVQEVGPQGCPPGTCIAIRDLFFNVPARRKFLKSDATEVGHIRHLLTTYALAYARVGWQLWIDDREVLRAPRDAALRERVDALFPPEWSAHLREVDWQAPPYHIRGLVADPRLTRPDRQEQYLFINGRPVSAAVLYFALQQAYAGALPNGQHPVVFLFIELPPSEVDVNVHPAKREVRFRHAPSVRDAVIAAVRQALHPDQPAPVPTPTAAPAAPPFPSAPARPAAPPPGFAYAGLTLLPKAEWEQWTAPSSPGSLAPETVPPPEPAPTPETKPPPSSEAPGWRTPGGETRRGTPWKRFRLVGQVGGLYTLVETEDGLVILDPSAAYERVLYERWLGQMQEGSAAAQGLLAPEVVNLPARDALTVREHLDALVELGLAIEAFGGDAFLVSALPAALAGLAPEAVLRDLAQALEQFGKRGAGHRLVVESLARAACRLAGRSHGRWTPAALEALLEALGRTDMPYTCPHGRPTMIYHGFAELRGKFGRS